MIPAGQPSDLYWYAFVPVRVVDGDTVEGHIDFGFRQWWHNARLRLYGIDTPELNDPDPAVRQKAVDAKSAVESAIMGKTVLLRSHMDRGDKYGRWLAVIWYLPVEGGAWMNLNAELVARGLARPYP